MFLVELACVVVVVCLFERVDFFLFKSSIVIKMHIELKKKIV